MGGMVHWRVGIVAATGALVPTVCNAEIHFRQVHMMNVRIVLVQEPTRAGFLPHTDRPDRFNRFIDELGKFAGASIMRMHGSLRDAIAKFKHEYLLLHTRLHPRDALQECGEAAQAGVAARLVALDQHYPKVAEMVLEPLSIAAAIDTWSYNTWVADHWSGTTSATGVHRPGVYGLTDVGARIGATLHPNESGRYCLFTGPRHEGGLPHLLVDYLRALDQVRSTAAR